LLVPVEVGMHLEETAGTQLMTAAAGSPRFTLALNKLDISGYAAGLGGIESSAAAAARTGYDTGL
jgi:hypothetical protein